MRPDRLTFAAIRRTTAFRLIAVLSLVYSLGLAGLAATIYARSAHELTARSDRLVREAAERLAASPPDALPAAVSAAAHQSDVSYAALLGSDGETIAGNIAVGGGLPLGRPFDALRRPSLAPVRMLVVRAATGERIVVARDVSQVREVRRSVLAIVIGSWVIVVVLTALAAFALGRAPLRRVRDLQEAARAIAAGRLGTRMPIAGRHDELDQFAMTVNTMVGEMERLIDQVRGVTDAIAHDLRTPLTRARGLVRRAETASGDDAAMLVSQGGAELDTVLARFAALLRIAQIEAGGRRAGFRRVDLAALLAEVVELYEPLAEDAGIALVASPAAAVWVEADQQLLVEAISNIVDNAVKFAASSVSITLTATNDNITIAVADDGPGIPADERDAVLRCFHRGANVGDRPGSGLGLSVVGAVLHLHGFTLSLETGDQRGLSARVIIPQLR